MYIIDYLIDFYGTNHQEFNGRWYVAKPYSYSPSLKYFITIELPKRLKDAWYVLTGKCEAFYFYEDFPNKKNYKQAKEGGE